MRSTLLRLLRPALAKLPAQYEIRSDTFAVCLLEVLGRHHASRIERVCSRKRNSILKTGRRDVGIQNSKRLDDFGIRVGKNRHRDSEPSREVFDRFGTVVLNHCDAESKLLIFR